MPNKEKTKERVRRYRERQKALHQGGVTSESVTGVTPGRLFTPSKFLSEEEDLKVEASVREHLAVMSGSRLASFRNLANTFVPNKVKDPSLVVPEI